MAKLAHYAHKVIVCEYNRAQITQAWLKLTELPLVISNKPVDSTFERNSDITKSDEAKDLIKKLVNKKLILYQGVVDAERPIETIASAVEELSDDYVFMVMTGSDCSHLRKYSKTVILSYITAPYHLEVTSHAFIGILIYTPVYGTFTSPLNSIYCAPNKLFEFSQFGIPMLGNDIPGLRYTISYNNMGCCIPSFSLENFKNAISNITVNYDVYSENAKKFYYNDKKSQIVKEALQKK
ncbi:hypothetical protein [Bacteroides stercorirosoris]|uniref:hypothetical protein n=1 Tax=Bacteroides stercorirosoris TaxID=871324 RepID=UPI0011DD5616|nr:hypothetical protein [Bacteroides stercorirosoris]